MVAQLKALLWDVLAPIPSRLILILCRYAQPVIIAESIKLFLVNDERSRKEPSTQIVMAAVFVYLGMAVGFDEGHNPVNCERADHDHSCRSQLTAIVSIASRSSRAASCWACYTTRLSQYTVESAARTMEEPLLSQ
jgi:hypothetical protein